MRGALLFVMLGLTGAGLSVAYAGGKTGKEAPKGDPLVREIDLKGFKAARPQGDVTKPTKIVNVEELARAIADKEWQERITKQVDFAKEQLVFFAWSGSGQDMLSFKVEGDKKSPLIVFSCLKGRSDDLRAHFRLYVLGKNTRWLADFTPSLNPCHPGCFPAGTLVQTPKGTRPIESIRKGEVVTMVRPDGTSVPGTVQSVFVTRNRLVKVETEAGVLWTTQTQPLCLSNGAFRAASELKAGDQILRWQDGKRQAVQVREALLTDREQEVFNLILGGSEVFIAGGFLARSKPPAETALSAPQSPPRTAIPAPK